MSTFAERYKSTDSRRSPKPKQDKPKETHVQPQKNQTAKNLILKQRKKNSEKQAPEEKRHIIYQGAMIWMTGDFSSESMEARRKEHILRLLKGKNC